MERGQSVISGGHASRVSSLCESLAAEAKALDATSSWPQRQLQELAAAGVFAWFLPQHLGGEGWSEADLLRVYMALARSCLTTTFILTQRQGAQGRIATTENEQLRDELLPDLISGRTFATVGISHLTTSRRHLQRPILRAEETSSGFVLEGQSPWVTGADHADHVVLGATLDDGRQILAAVPTDLPGISAAPPERLVALSASHTGPLLCDRALVQRRWLLAGPVHEVMKQGLGARTGGLQTSALALGLASAAIEFLQQESARRPDLSTSADSLQREYEQLQTELLALAEDCGGGSAEEIRSRANSLVLRTTQSALAAAKGAGFVAGHPVGRWCREALFFLVWSCPQSVLAANLCELAGLG
jgi:alkylation response protein AidB-like acyl-CoA dehydrogenase